VVIAFLEAIQLPGSQTRDMYFSKAIFWSSLDP
jgi:hypothetical protein